MTNFYLTYTAPEGNNRVFTDRFEPVSFPNSLEARNKGIDLIEKGIADSYAVLNLAAMLEAARKQLED